ncbi:MAG: hypothetical protein AAF711_19060 [Planctomycetota bacterium]
MTSHRQQHGLRNGGYALLITLVMLALLGVILGGLARRSADAALQARAAEQAMRQQWAELSCSYTLLNTAADRAEQRLGLWQASFEEDAYASSVVDPPGGYEVFSLKLAGLEVWGRIDDEEAKLNLNERLRASPDRVIMPSSVVDEAIAPNRSTGLYLTREPFVRTLGLRPLMSWAQVLPGWTPQALLGINRPEALLEPHSTQAVVSRATLWGDGTLNIWTGQDHVIRQRLRDLVEPGTVENLIGLRIAEPALTLGTLIENAAEDKDERALLQGIFTERSSAYGMWLAVRDETEQDAASPRWSLWVLEQGNDQEPGRPREHRW